MSADEHFSLGVEPRGSVVVLTASGELDAASVGDVEGAFSRTVAEHEGHVVFDACDVTFIDSTGVSAIVAGMRRLNRSRRRLAVACSNESPLGRALSVTGLNHTFDCHPTADDAVSALDGAPLLGR